MPGGIDPLAERLLETVVTVGNVLGGATRTSRRDPPVEGTEHAMAEGDLRRHRPRLLHRDAVEGRLTHDADLAMLETEAGAQFGRRRGSHGRRSQQQKACRGHSTTCTT